MVAGRGISSPSSKDIYLINHLITKHFSAMKKLIFLLASAGLLLTACIAEDSGMQEQIGEAVIIGATYEAPEAEPGTRSIIENGGAFKWSASDSFNAYSTGTTTESFEANVFEINDYGVDEHRASASFIGYGIPGRIKDVAVCPATLKPTWAAASQTLKVTYPSEITWVKGEADPYMVARGFEVGAKNLSFKNLGGIIKLTINEIPKNARKVAVTIWGGRITGEFTVGQTTESSTTYWVVNDDVTTSEPSTVTFTFSAGDPEGMTFYVPVPVMEYSKIGFSVIGSNDETLFSFASSEKTRTVARKQIVSFPSITFVEGGGEGSFSNVITTDSGQTGTVTLPSTKNDVYVLMNSTAGEITLVPGSEDPEEVYITVLKDATVNSLNVNLPKSTVFIKGEDNSNLSTLNSTTSDQTLRVQKSPLTIGTATINQGNARIEGTVNSIVVASGATSDGKSAGDNNKVEVFVTKDAALQTVTLNAKTDVVVEQPQGKIDVTATEDKVYVIVNAEGSTATAQNGGDIYVTANANCSVTADGVDSTDPDNKSTAKVENNSGGIIETEAKDDGVIETGAQVVKAKIGNVEYYTLNGSEGAFANVKDGETINLLVSVTLGQNPFNVALENKAVTLDLGGNTLFGRTNLKSGSLTVQNGAIVCEDGQPLNVYGKETSAQNYSVLTVASNVTVSGEYGVCIFGPTFDSKPGYGAVANIAGKINATYPVFVSGNLGNNITEDMNNVVNINSGAVLTSTTDVAVALNGWATVNVKSGATINGSTGIAVKRGVLNVEDGATVTANGEWTTPPAANNNGTEPTGAAVSMTPTYSQYGAMAVNITGGTFSATGTGSEALYKSNGTYQSDATFTVTGGTFSSDPTAFVAPGYVANENTDGTWTVAKSAGAVSNLQELQEAIANNITPILYIGESPISEKVAISPSVETTIKGLKINYTSTSTSPSEIALKINGNVTIEDAVITTQSNVGVQVESNKTVTIKNSTIDASNGHGDKNSDGRAINVDGGANVTIDHCVVKGPATTGYCGRGVNIIGDSPVVNIINGTTISTSHYAINLVGTAVNADVNVTNSTIDTGWAITNIWKTGNTINLTNCTLNSVNDKDYNGWNNFSAFVFNKDKTNISSDNVVTVNNCAVNVSSTKGNLQSLISMRGNNDTIKFIGSDGTISLAENGGITYQWGQLASPLNNTLSFDNANYDQISESIDAACVVTNANNLYTITYIAEVYYYWDTNDGQEGAYCSSLADPFESSSYILSNGEYIRLEKDIALTKNITVTLSDYLTAGNYFTMQFGEYTITKGNYSIILPAGLSVKTDKQTDVFTAADGAELVETVENDVYTYTAEAKNYVAQIGDVKYESLAEAVAAVPTDGTKTTIQMIADETMATEAKLTVAANQNIVLDLNGKTISGSHAANDASFYFITNKGTLEITDTSSGKNGKITASWSNANYSYECVTIYNLGGTLTLSAGKVETTSGGLGYAINNSSNAWGVGDDKESVFNMTGGTLNAPSGDAALRVYQNCGGYATPLSHNLVNISGGTIATGGIFLDETVYKDNANPVGDGILTDVTISGGEIHGLIDLKMRHSFNTTFHITGGTFVDAKLWIRKHSEWHASVAEPTAPIFFISGGNFSFVNNMAFGLEYNCNGTSWTSYTKPYSITGGTFNHDPSAYVAAGYEAVKSGDNWNVQVKAQTGYAWDNGVLPSAPSVSGNVINVTNANAQYALDGAYGSIDGKTINFTENITSTLELGRPTKYAGSNTKYYRSSYNTEERTLEFILENSGKVVDGNYTNLYKRSVKNVKFTANSGVSIKGIYCNAGNHIYGAGSYDCVREIHTTSEGSVYFCANDIEGITFEGITFTSPSNLETSVTEASMKNVTFKNCIFNIGSTTSGNYALRYYQESKTTSEVKNLVVDGCTFNTVYQGVYTMHINGVTVKNCTFTTTGHNAIAVQTQDVAFNHGNVVLTGNTGTGIGDRFIRFNNVASGTNITITGNNATYSKGTNDKECIKASSLASGITYNVSGNTWINYKEAYNEELRDK